MPLDKPVSKTIIIAINIVLLMFAISILAGMIYILYGKPNPKDMQDENTGYWIPTSTQRPELVWLTIIFTIIMAGFALLGCCGTLTENQFLLTIYSLALIVLFVLHIVQIVLLCLTILTAEGRTRKGMETQLKEYEINREAQSSIDVIQQKYKCCGIVKYSDWENAIGYIPYSCCEKEPTAYNCTVREVIHRAGCLMPIKNERKRHCTILLSNSIVGAIVVLFAFMLVSRIRETALEPRMNPNVHYQPTTPELSLAP